MIPTLATQLTELTKKLDSAELQKLKNAILTAKASIEQSFDPNQTIQPGSKLPTLAFRRQWTRSLLKLYFVVYLKVKIILG